MAGMHQLLVQFADGAFQLLKPLVLALVSWAVTRYVHNARVAAAVKTLSSLASTVVESLEQSTVRTLKASNGWNAATKQSVRDIAVVQIKTVGAALLKQLPASDAFVVHLVEEAVGSQFHHAPTAVPGPSVPLPDAVPTVTDGASSK